MTSLYLYVNAVLYAVFALWCTVAAHSTAQAIGYVELSNAGNSEYRVVYGGLQLGLAAVFFYLAGRPELADLGLLFALAMYVPIVAWRLATVAAYWPVPPVTLGVAGMEAALLVLAVLLRWSAR